MSAAVTRRLAGLIYSKKSTEPITRISVAPTVPSFRASSVRMNVEFCPGWSARGMMSPAASPKMNS